MISYQNIPSPTTTTTTISDPSFLLQSTNTTNTTNTTKIHKSTGKNNYYILTQSFLAMGGGDGQFGLWIDEGLCNCFMGPCDTFDGVESINGELQRLEIYCFEF
jgi:TLD